MPALANVILTDRAGTPVNHTFTPLGRDGDGGRYFKAASSPLGDYRLTVTPRLTPGGRRKVDISLSLPVLVTETVNGVNNYVVARTSRAKVSFDFDSQSTLQERKDLIGMIYTALAAGTGQINSVLADGEMVW